MIDSTRIEILLKHIKRLAYELDCELEVCTDPDSPTDEELRSILGISANLEDYASEIHDEIWEESRFRGEDCA